jgi:hypothetical protein
MMTGWLMRVGARFSEGKSMALTRVSLEMNRQDRRWLFIRLILRRAQTHALSRDAIIA